MCVCMCVHVGARHGIGSVMKRMQRRRQHRREEAAVKRAARREGAVQKRHGAGDAVLAGWALAMLSMRPLVDAADCIAAPGDHR
eukprot:2027422-Rhodomonas_salina.3